MSKRILITAGPTNEYIDEVMKITNMSTGRLGIELSRELTSRGNEVTLICTRSVARSGLYERYHLADNELLRTIQIETTEQMFKALEAEQGNDYDLVVHAAAVGDYKADFSFRMEDMAEEIAKNIRQFLFYKEGSRIRGVWSSRSMAKVILDTLTNPSCKVNDDTASLSLIPPEAFTSNPKGLTVSYINFTSSTFAPTPFLTNPVEVLTKSAPAFADNSQAVLISSEFNKSVSRITFNFFSLQAVFITLISSNI